MHKGMKVWQNGFVTRAVGSSWVNKVAEFYLITVCWKCGPFEWNDNIEHQNCASRYSKSELWISRLKAAAAHFAELTHRCNELDSSIFWNKRLYLSKGLAALHDKTEKVSMRRVLAAWKRFYIFAKARQLFVKMHCVLGLADDSLGFSKRACTLRTDSQNKISRITVALIRKSSRKKAGAKSRAQKTCW